MLEGETFRHIFLRENYMTSCLLESLSVRKTKINLSDYNYQKDIQNRLLMAQFSHSDLAVLEAILYSSLQIPIPNLAKDLEMPIEELLSILNKITATGLFQIEKQTIIVDKEARKYFELQIQKFEDDFLPDMDFLQNILKKVPIHVLPIWYSISRTSNNIFNSLIEKHLSTPQIFHRYLADLNFDPVLKQIVEDVHTAENLEVSVEEIMQKHSLTREAFEESMLYLEFHFVCCLKYQKTESGWKELVTPFHEWKEYLSFIQKTEASSIPIESAIQTNYSEENGCLLLDLMLILRLAQKQAISLKKNAQGILLPEDATLAIILKKLSYASSESKELYIDKLIKKLVTMDFIDLSQNKIHIEEIAEKWLASSIEEQSLYLYRHAKNRIPSSPELQEVCTEKAIREVEKSLLRVLYKGWVFFDEFIQGAHIALQDSQLVSLQKTGKTWNYTLPSYSSHEKDFFREMLLVWLAEAGCVQVGCFQNKDCFRITNLGQKLFAR